MIWSSSLRRLPLLLAIAFCVWAPHSWANAAHHIDALCPRIVHNVFENCVPLGYLNAGNYTVAGTDTLLADCVRSCCAKQAQCNVALMAEDKCYHVQCISNALCMPHKRADNTTDANEDDNNNAKNDANLSPRMVLVHPVDGDTAWLDTLKSANIPLEQLSDSSQITEQIDDSAPLPVAASLSSSLPPSAMALSTDDSGQPIMYADLLTPLSYAEKSAEDTRDAGIYRGFANADPPLYGNVGDLQMDESQLYGQQQLSSCLLDDVNVDAETEALAGHCELAHEICAPVSRASHLGVCECVDGYARNARGDCVARGPRLDDLVEVAAAAADEPISRVITPVSAVAAPQTSTAVPSPLVPLATPARPSGESNKLTVSVLSKDVRLPEREVTLAAYTISDDINGNASQYKYLWSLISQPGGDVNGTMSDQTKDTIRLTNLSEGLYRFKVVVTAANDTGEAYANVTVSPQKRINRAPQVSITPDAQTVKLPASKAILDGSTSTDDDRIVTWHWDLIQGPIGYHPQLPEISTLQLADLTAPGNYTFRLTLTDSDGARNASTACVTVLKANDYPPEANAGSDVILYLPVNHVTLNGSLSTDDREITSWEWTKDSSVESKAVDMQNTRTPYLALSNLQEGIYAFELRVGDASNQTSTARVHVFVKPPPANRAPEAKAGANTTISLPRTWLLLNGSATNDVRAVRFEWTQRSGPNQAGLVAGTADGGAVANATGLTVGVYVFRLNAWSEGGLNDTDDVWVTVVQETNQPPVANAGGDQTIAMPVREIYLNGSRSSDDLGIVNYTWTRAGSSLAIGTVIGGTDRQAVMILSNIYPGRYVFLLRVTDAQGATAVDTASVIVHPDPMLMHLVELTFAVDVSRWTQSEVDSLQQRLLLLFGDGTQLHVCDMRVDRKRSEVILVFYAEQPVGGDMATMVPMAGHDVERTLAQRFWREPDILGATVTDVRTSLCQNTCSAHGVCEADTRACACDAFWMPDVFWFWGMAEANCNWSILYVVIGVLVVFLCVTACCWGLTRMCRRDGSVKKTLRKRAKVQKYSPLGTQDDEIPTLTQSAATLSETDTDSDIVFESSRTKSGSSGSVRSGKHDVETGSLRGGGGKSRNGMTRLGRRLRT